MADNPALNPPELLRRHAPWLLAPELGVCVVGSAALAEACRRAGIRGPEVADLDLAWALDTDDGQAVLEQHGVYLPTTTANRERGTLALKLGGHRIEITSFRASDSSAPIAERIVCDLGARDMTVGALAWWLCEDDILDPHSGLEHWRERRVVPVGDVRERVAEHPVRWIRYYRRACAWEFALDNSVRKLPVDAELLATIPPEVLAGEFRAALLDCASPGRMLVELNEAGLLPHLTPELAPQFDGRPAGPVRHHPEVGQALHLVLSLQWAAAHTLVLPDPDRLTVAIATLCHDLGKGLTPPDEFPSHRGHEEAGVRLISTLLDRLPSLADASTRRMAEAVSRLHQIARDFDQLRPGTWADLYERHFRQRSFRVDLFALAVGADVGGRLDMTAEGEQVARQVEADITWLRERCGSVDARGLRERHTDDTEFREALHQARAEALRRR